ncbi:serine palmitoyltransferase 1 [Cephus cinctus]|uniref:Serine palmitoyltransferase 1 n=1 Tax=Cephus cinctus TaxID=211228 RepID=A0AAJ7FPE0_CEPCN|nr:serine palmitoyltransferase 1 [Cephus cinctus]
MNSKFAFLESMDILNTIPQYHTLLAALLVLWLLWLIAKRRYGNHRTVLSDDEVQCKLAEWQPEPLVPKTEKNHPSLTPKHITSRVGKRIIVNGKDCLNLGTHNYLGFLENKEIQEKAVATIKKYGVGSCGPRGFYGTVDVHLELEERLANFMEMEEAIVYSYGFSTTASAISAYCKRNDLVFTDEKVNFAIQKGLDASRSNIKYFQHNDVQDLESLLIKQAELDTKNPKKATRRRRFLIVEGIYTNTGQICPLPELVTLCRKYKLRIFVDESISFGTLGKCGKGVTEHFGVPRHEVDMIIGSLEGTIGSIGGFCVGSSFVIEHQRLSGLGYCFSASLPPLLTSAAITSIDIMERDPQIFMTLKEICVIADQGLREIEYFEVSSFPESPVKHLYLKNALQPAEEQKVLTSISNKCIENNVAIIVPAYLPVERDLPRPSLRICVSVLLKKTDIDFALKTLVTSTKEVLFQ